MYMRMRTPESMPPSWVHQHCMLAGWPLGDSTLNKSCLRQRACAWVWCSWGKIAEEGEKQKARTGVRGRVQMTMIGQGIEVGSSLEQQMCKLQKYMEKGLQVVMSWI